MAAPSIKTQAQPVSKGARDVHENPKVPDFRVPTGAVDAHCHVFGPSDVFPYSPIRKYTPYDAPAEKLFALRDHLGFEKNVLVQASCHGKNNDAMVDCLNKAGENARGVAIVDPSITDEELRALDAAGVRGVRFNFLKRLVDPTPKSEYLGIAKRVAKMGWHVVVYFEAEELEEIAPFLESIPTIVVIDHMGRPDVSLGADDPQFERFIRLMDENSNFWVKVSCPERLSISGPPYEDVVPFARTLVERFPDRVLWGTDWPHPNMKTHTPDDGQLVDRIPHIARTKALQHSLLVGNPMHLYWPGHAIPKSDT
ncbi:2-pyrone-4,6-dicarboxylate hydrolase [Litorimonas cladophorae]|uniref:2-pyrone-4,6-dicarboxylate hydrolase n=1 Tax=Litorimonas cladophorae TaxID=1220491 RepID=A0A918NDV0_9PROT|nr:amidohydrolase family protein [Litorimonas cladophorae]GGX63067.1 2-pyrone-4,6-dicarboxylate hydrolase [Litorimonas cladophorae]